jgi:hypothetical protein
MQQRMGSAPDPLYRHAVLSQTAEIPVLGVPVLYQSNSAEVITCVEDAFHGWKNLAPETSLRSSERPTVRIILQEPFEFQPDGVSLIHRLPDAERLLMSTGRDLACADTARQDAIAYVTRAALERPEEFRYSILESLTLFLVTALDRQPVHAGAVLQRGSALLLSGPSGVGKSTLCYAALRAGLQVLSDEAVYVQQRPRMRIWGLPGRIRLEPGARAQFAELVDAIVRRQPNGKDKVVVRVSSSGGIPVRPVAERAGICLLRRGEECALRKIGVDELERHMLDQMESGFDLFADTVRPLLRDIGRMGAWELTLSTSPQAAVPLLLQALQELARASAT